MAEIEKLKFVESHNQYAYIFIDWYVSSVALSFARASYYRMCLIAYDNGVSIFNRWVSDQVTEQHLILIPRSSTFVTLERRKGLKSKSITLTLLFSNRISPKRINERESIVADKVICIGLFNIIIERLI